jgi:hypothetical protein
LAPGFPNRAHRAGAPFTRVTRGTKGILIETGGTSVCVGLREWPMPLGRGVRSRFAYPQCDARRDVLYWANGSWGCRGCLGLDFESRHQHGGARPSAGVRNFC